MALIKSSVRGAAIADVAAILLFVAVGRRSHDEGGNPVLGALEVAAPFFIALCAGWLAARAWRRPADLTTGLVVWASTVAVGMALRRTAFDRGTALSFVIVATIATGVLLLGWRIALRALRSIRS